MQLLTCILNINKYIWNVKRAQACSLWECHKQFWKSACWKCIRSTRNGSLSASTPMVSCSPIFLPCPITSTATQLCHSLLSRWERVQCFQAWSLDPWRTLIPLTYVWLVFIWPRFALLLAACFIAQLISQGSIHQAISTEAKHKFPQDAGRRPWDLWHAEGFHWLLKHVLFSS